MQFVSEFLSSKDRVFIIGDVDGCTMRPFERATEENKTSLFERILPYRTVRDAFRGLPLIDSPYPANHVGRVHSDRIKRRYASLKPGERDHHTRINKLDLDRPSFTNHRWIRQRRRRATFIQRLKPEKRPLVRVLPGFRAFPDWWEFSGTSRHPIRQVGNAVPPLFAAAVGNEIRDQIFAMGRQPLNYLLEALGQKHLFGQREVQQKALSASVA